MLRISKSPINESQSVGFNLKFSNGWTVSVQFGDHNYCDNYKNIQSPFEYAAREVGPEALRCKNAEVAAWHDVVDPKTGDSEEEWYDFGTNTVKGYLDADEVSDFIHMIRNLEENYNDTVQKEPID